MHPGLGQQDCLSRCGGEFAAKLCDPPWYWGCAMDRWARPVVGLKVKLMELQQVVVSMLS